MHEGAWRHPTVDPSAVWDPRHYRDMVVLAEEGKFDAVFITDELTSPAGQGGDDAAGRFEPVTLLSYIAAATERIGLVATVSTSFSEPYNVARMFATLDYVSGGRAGWNIVTTASDRAAKNFGKTLMEDHDARYLRAAEFVDIVVKLWESWGPDAVLADRSSPNYLDLDQVRSIDHQGKYFAVKGPLNIPRCPQGRPALFQAGSSHAGIEFAAATADAVFTVQQSIEDAIRFSGKVADAAARHFRDRKQLRIFPGVVPYIADTEVEAEHLRAELDGLMGVQQAVAELGIMLGADFSAEDPAGPVPEFLGARSDTRASTVRKMGREPGMTLARLAQRAGASRGHRIVVGTAQQVAADLEQWFRAGAADGFMVAPPVLPLGLRAFVEKVVPILQDRGLYRRDYAGATLRAHLAAGE